jgi:pyridinium-3,5-bisthiocarboxylic acid mononucleotide nickel chelatase
MKLAYFDCFCGAAGDMIVGACLDAGADESFLREELAKLQLSEVDLHIEKVTKNGISATSFHPRIDEHAQSHKHRHLPHIVELIQKARLSETVTSRAIQIFERLAQAEAKIHNTTPYKIHFHEVGAADAIMDIVGACVVLESLGVDKFYCSSFAVGSGTVKCAHGVLPVPAPATAELIRGIPLRPSEATGELLTPTGAAILTTLAEEFGPLPAMTIEQIGYGAGQRDLQTMPNVLRLLVGQSEPGLSGTITDDIIVLEANLDDATAELIGHVTEQLLLGGALDVFCTSIAMKKNRPGTQISVLTRPQEVANLETILLTESTTFGVRRHACLRSTLRREHQTVNTKYGPIRVKIGYLDNKAVTVSPEYDDCARAVQNYKVPLKKVFSAAQTAYNTLKS